MKSHAVRVQKRQKKKRKKRLTIPLYSFGSLTLLLLPVYGFRLICMICILVNTRRYLDVDSTLFGRYRRRMDVKTTLRAYWDVYVLEV